MTARKIIVWLVLLVVVANLALVAVVFMGTMNTVPVAPPLPTPNGHDDFVKAGRMLVTTPESYKNISPAQTRELVMSNAPALSLVRLGMTRDCLVPVNDLRWKIEEHTAELNNFKSLSLAFYCEAMFADQQHRPNDIAASMLDVVRFCHAFSRGGGYADFVMAMSCENFGLSHLSMVLKELDARNSEHVAKELEDIDAKSETFAQVVDQEKIYTGKLTFRQSLSHLVHGRRYKSYENLIATKFNEEIRQRRNVMVMFAARAYELEKGKQPATVADLVPTYLKAVPQNPVTGAPIELKTLSVTNQSK